MIQASDNRDWDTRQMAAEIKRLKSLIARAADALETDQMSYSDYDKLVADLREAAK
jgi:hypothetical protein